MIKGWRLNPFWVAHREAKRDQANAEKAARLIREAMQGHYFVATPEGYEMHKLPQQVLNG